LERHHGADDEERDPRRGDEEPLEHELGDARHRPGHDQSGPHDQLEQIPLVDPHPLLR
jgi:hypothetical protein